MSDTQLELPQISLGRYLDLLKRRRWQVIPVSLLGLLIGGTVAFFIPRYYVAETRLEYFRKPVEVQSPQEDPFKLVVDNATVLLPQAAAATMAKLGWSESREPDLSKRRDLERETESNVKVYDVNPQANRPYANLVVTYRDRDGQRSATFLNELVQTWMDQRIAEMRRQADAQREIANQHVRDARGEWSAINRDLSNLSARYDFSRLLGEGAMHEELRIRGELLKERIQKRDEAEITVARLEKRLENLQKQIDGTTRTVESTADALKAKYKPDSEEGKLLAELAARETAVKLMGEAHPMRAANEAALVELREKAAKLLVGGPEGLNPAIDKLKKEKDEVGEELAGARRILARLVDEVRAESERNVQRAQAEQEFFEKSRALVEAEKRRDVAQEELQAALTAQEQLDRAPPIRQVGPALVPKRPTEPNIFLVAVIGCVVGLGIAIALILLLDFLQGTLKTVDDVERSLPVPMLGGVSHLETIEERRRASAGRRRASIVAGVFLLGAVVVLTTYYVAPHRLPPFARDLLSMVLGG